MSEKKLSPLRQKDIRTGAKQERERIIKLLNENSHTGFTGHQVLSIPVEAMVGIINGENE